MDTIDLRLLIGVADGDDAPTLAAATGRTESFVRRRLRGLAGRGDAVWLRQTPQGYHLTERGRAGLGTVSRALTASELLTRLLGVESVSLRHAEVVVTIAATGSIGSAATRLQIPQPSLSAQLTRIEQRWQTTLFTRTHHGIRPTALLTDALPHLRLLAQTLSCPTASSHGNEPATTAGDLQLVSEFAFHGLLDALRDQTTADVRHHVIDIPGTDWPPTMLAADICLYADLPFVSLTTPAGRDKAVAFEDPAHILMPRGAGDGRPTVSLRELADFDWLTGPPGTRNHQSVVLLCRSAGFEPRIRYTALNGASGRHILEDGLAVALTSATMMPGEKMTVVRLAEDIRVRMTVSWGRGGPASSTAQWVTRWLRAGHVQRLAALRPALLAEMRADPARWPALAGG
ncbi:LysR family transcriptional regulator [Micromonospora sp. NPDC050980]|uniref:LysR family transcriptional regulator n=1 Tax=Micromonospora sp. NPDC050980 TaxID=3155161 RepID=UPI0033CA0AB2